MRQRRLTMRRNVAASACRSLRAWVMTRREKKNVERRSDAAAQSLYCGVVELQRMKRKKAGFPRKSGPFRLARDGGHRPGEDAT